MDFTAFDKSKIERYKTEAKEKWGDTEAFKEYEKKSSTRTASEQSVINQGLLNIFNDFGKIKEKSPNSESAQKLVENLKNYISENFYNCTNEILSCLGQMYSAGGEMTDNINKSGGDGTADFASKAIKIYCCK